VPEQDLKIRVLVDSDKGERNLDNSRRKVKALGDESKRSGRNVRDAGRDIDDSGRRAQRMGTRMRGAGRQVAGVTGTVGGLKRGLTALRGAFVALGGVAVLRGLRMVNGLLIESRREMERVAASATNTVAGMMDLVFMGAHMGDVQKMVRQTGVSDVSRVAKVMYQARSGLPTTMNMAEKDLVTKQLLRQFRGGAGAFDMTQAVEYIGTFVNALSGDLAKKPAEEKIDMAIRSFFGTLLLSGKGTEETVAYAGRPMGLALSAGWAPEEVASLFTLGTGQYTARLAATQVSGLARAVNIAPSAAMQGFLDEHGLRDLTGFERVLGVRRTLGAMKPHEREAVMGKILTAEAITALNLLDDPEKFKDFSARIKTMSEGVSTLADAVNNTVEGQIAATNEAVENAKQYAEADVGMRPAYQLAEVSKELAKAQYVYLERGVKLPELMKRKLRGVMSPDAKEEALNRMAESFAAYEKLAELYTIEELEAAEKDIRTRAARPGQQTYGERVFMEGMDATTREIYRLVKETGLVETGVTRNVARERRRAASALEVLRTKNIPLTPAMEYAPGIGIKYIGEEGAEVILPGAVSGETKHLNPPREPEAETETKEKTGDKVSVNIYGPTYNARNLTDRLLQSGVSPLLGVA